MNETRVLLNAAATLSSMEGAALATIVKVTGSAYRGPGARLLILPDGRTVGAVSAGCLERDLVERARRVLASGTPDLAIYDTSDLGDNVWGLGIGCGGTIEVLIESLKAGTPAARMLPFLRERLGRRDIGAAALIFRVAGIDAAVGSRVLATDTETENAGVSDTAFASWLRQEISAARLAGRSMVSRYTSTAGLADVLVEVITPTLPLVIFGAGDDAIPLAQVADVLGWNVTVVDSRPGLAQAARFPTADCIVVGQPEQVWDRVPLGAGSVAVVMTHNYSHDLSILSHLLASPVRYLGILGTRKRTAAMLRVLAAQGSGSEDGIAARVHGPVGMDIGAETPAEIALAIAAEIQTVCAGRSGGFLNTRPGPIHERNLRERL